MFDVEKEIKEWRRGFTKYGAMEDALLNDMEWHLREVYEVLTGEGLGAAEAFQQAIKQVGSAPAVAAEYGKNRELALDRRAPWRPARFMPGLLVNYFRIACRRIIRYKVYSFINICGLAAGMACGLLIILYIGLESGYDRFHRKAGRIYRVTLGDVEEGCPTNANGSMAIGPALKKDFPEIEEYARIRKPGQGEKILAVAQDRKFYEERFFFASPGVLTIFDFPLERGNPATALNEPGSLVITGEMARKYFPGQDPMGKTIQADPYNDGTLMPFRITGIARNVPRNSHWHFDFLASDNSQREEFMNNFAAIFQNYTYVLLRSEVPAASLQQKLPEFLKKYWSGSPAPWYNLYLQPLTSIRLHSHLRSEVEPTGDVTYILVFSLIALFIILIACINYANLATARADQRGKEVGVRKACGASRSQLIRQFLGESVTTSLTAGPVALILAATALPFFNMLSNQQVTMRMFLEPRTSLSLLTLVVLSGLLAGLIPALLLSRSRHRLTSSSRPQSANGGFRKWLVTVQFSLSIITIFCACISWRQLRFMENRNPGFHKQGMMIIPLNNTLRDKQETFRTEILRIPGVEGLTTSDYVPTRGSAHWSFQFEGRHEPVTQVVYQIDPHFFSTYGLKLTAGRPVTKAITRDSPNEFVISESSVKEAGYSSAESAIGKFVQIDNVRGTITGVAADINIYSLHQQPYAIVYFIRPVKYHKYLSVRLNPQNLPATMQAIADNWQKMVPEYPLDYFFLDASFQQLHINDAKVGTLIGIFSVLTTFIAGLGLFGLSLFTIEQKTKEIAVRKVLGASPAGLVAMLGCKFGQWVVLANLIAWPIAYFLMEQWLQQFAYQTQTGWGAFAISGTGALFIALLTVIIPVWRTARANPAAGLRYE